MKTARAAQRDAFGVAASLGADVGRDASDLEVRRLPSRYRGAARRLEDL